MCVHVCVLPRAMNGLRSTETQAVRCCMKVMCEPWWRVYFQGRACVLLEHSVKKTVCFMNTKPGHTK